MPFNPQDSPFWKPKKREMEQRPKDLNPSLGYYWSYYLQWSRTQEHLERQIKVKT